MMSLLFLLAPVRDVYPFLAIEFFLADIAYSQRLSPV